MRAAALLVLLAGAAHAQDAGTLAPPDRWYAVRARALLSDGGVVEVAPAFVLTEARGYEVARELAAERARSAELAQLLTQKEGTAGTAAMAVASVVSSLVSVGLYVAERLEQRPTK